MNKCMQEAKAIRASIAGLAANQTDEILIDNMAAFPHWSGNGVQYLTGMLVQYDGKLYRVIQPHNSQPDWTPDKVPALFVRVSVEEFPEWVQPTGAHDAYKKGDKVTHNGLRWISEADSNVWEPGVYGWTNIN